MAPFYTREWKDDDPCDTFGAKPVYYQFSVKFAIFIFTLQKKNIQTEHSLIPVAPTGAKGGNKLSSNNILKTLSLVFLEFFVFLTY